jgi:hypothetical protein
MKPINRRMLVLFNIELTVIDRMRDPATKVKDEVAVDEMLMMHDHAGHQVCYSSLIQMETFLCISLFLQINTIVTSDCLKTDEFQLSSN